MVFATDRRIIRDPSMLGLCEDIVDIPATKFAITATILILFGIIPSQLAAASPYSAGYDHGCSDAGISNPDDRSLTNQIKVQAAIVPNLCQDIMLDSMLVPVAAMAPDYLRQ